MLLGSCLGIRSDKPLSRRPHFPLLSEIVFPPACADERRTKFRRRTDKPQDPSPSYSLGFHCINLCRRLVELPIPSQPPKCHIGYQSLILLGQRVSRLGISTHQEKIDAVDAMKPPTKVKELQMFLGFVNYFAIYIPFYTWITRPLYQLLLKDVEWEWTPIHQEAFDLCKLTLKSTPILGHLMDGRGYRLYTDASDFGIGAVLQQIQPIKIGDLKGTQLYERLQKAYKLGDTPLQLVTIADKDEVQPHTTTWNDNFEETEVYIERVIAYWSRLLKSAEKNYSPTEKEAHSQVHSQEI